MLRSGKGVLLLHLISSMHAFNFIGVTRMLILFVLSGLHPRCLNSMIHIAKSKKGALKISF